MCGCGGPQPRGAQPLPGGDGRRDDQDDHQPGLVQRLSHVGEHVDETPGKARRGQAGSPSWCPRTSHAPSQRGWAGQTQSSGAWRPGRTAAQPRARCLRRTPRPGLGAGGDGGAAESPAGLGVRAQGSRGPFAHHGGRRALGTPASGPGGGGLVPRVLPSAPGRQAGGPHGDSSRPEGRASPFHSRPHCRPQQRPVGGATTPWSCVPPTSLPTGVLPLAGDSRQALWPGGEQVSARREGRTQNWRAGRPGQSLPRPPGGSGARR